MKPSQKRQLRCWVSIWAKSGALFAVTMAVLSFAATTSRKITAEQEHSRSMLIAAVQQGQIQAWPLPAPRKESDFGASSSASTAVSSSVIIVAPPSTTTPPNTSTVPFSLTLSRDDGGTKTLSSPCALGQVCYLEVSLDLRSWARVSTNIATSTQVIFGITDNPMHQRVFYRLTGNTPSSPPPPPSTKPGDGGIFVSPTTGGGTTGKLLRPTGRVSSVVTNMIGSNATGR